MRLLAACLFFVTFCIFSANSLTCYEYTQQQLGGSIKKSNRTEVQCADNVKFCWSLNREDDEENYYEENCEPPGDDTTKCSENGCRSIKGKGKTTVCCCNTDDCNKSASGISKFMVFIASLLYIFSKY